MEFQNNENGTKNLMFLDQLAKKKPSLSIKENIHKVHLA